MRSSLASTTIAALLALGLAACGDSTGPEGTTTVAFTAATGSGSSSAAARGISFSHSGDGDAATLTVEGSNGRLTLASVHFVMEEFELERADEDADCDDAPDEDACEEFETGPRFLELPLSGEDAVAVRQTVPPDRYDELEFEIDDLDDDEQETLDLLEDIRGQFADWPEDGSLRLHGTFTPKDSDGTLLEGQAEDFVVFFEAEVEIEKEFASPVEVTEESGSITVTVDPRVWFDRADGTVLDLSRFDFDPQAGGPVPELEVEIEDEVGEGFVEIEFRS